MIEIDNKSRCCGCSACANICPKKCISMVSDERGFLYPTVNKSVCVNCERCNKICPVLNPKTAANDKSAYAAYNTDEKTREISSSGGIFGCIANEILNRRGVVFGAAFSEDFKTVKHIGVENGNDLKKLYGSKYLQSEMCDSYKSAEEYLKADREVLFVGTSCQISGLKAYLQKDYAKLLTVDVICHGTPSPRVWGEYATAKEDEFQSEIIKVDFRNKRFGWAKSVLLLLLFADGTEYCALGSKDEYIKGFLMNLYLRESCYGCVCKGDNVLSDISLGDFWGIDSVLPNFSDNKGASAIILNTAKGKGFFDSIKEGLAFESVTYNDILIGNPALVTPVAKPRRCDKFWELYHKRGLRKAYKECLKVSIARKGYIFARRVGSKIKRTIIFLLWRKMLCQKNYDQKIN